MKNKSEIEMISVDNALVTSHEGFTVKADRQLGDALSADLDLLVIPGGSPESYSERKDIQRFLQDVASRGTPIAAICGGPEFLAQAGLLVGKRITHGHDPEYAAKVFTDCIVEDADVVVDGKIITADGQAYAEFAVEVYDFMGLFESSEEKQETLDWLKNRQ
jgi:putative intracellular protease/amidase